MYVKHYIHYGYKAHTHHVRYKQNVRDEKLEKKKKRKKIRSRRRLMRIEARYKSSRSSSASESTEVELAPRWAAHVCAIREEEARRWWITSSTLFFQCDEAMVCRVPRNLARRWLDYSIRRFLYVPKVLNIHMNEIYKKLIIIKKNNSKLKKNLNHIFFLKSKFFTAWNKNLSKQSRFCLLSIRWTFRTSGTCFL